CLLGRSSGESLRVEPIAVVWALRWPGVLWSWPGVMQLVGLLGRSKLVAQL
ncbi:MAG: hypothetical protein AVDCRST_MAG15-3329, partial [uncultured Rubellimicrobium sp.]